MSHDIANRGEILLYSDENGREFVNVIFKDETFWLTQKAMSELFDCTTDNISRHLKNIFTDGELDKDSVTEKFSVTAADGKNYQTQHYNLNAIIAVGYRVNSRKRLDSASGRLKRSRSTSRKALCLKRTMHRCFLCSETGTILIITLTFPPAQIFRMVCRMPH